MLNILLILLFGSSYAIQGLEEGFEDQFTPFTQVQNETCSPSFCLHSRAVSDSFKTFCKLRNSTIQARCCVQDLLRQELIIGLDYTSCNIESLTKTVGSLQRDALKDVEYLDIRNNTLSECGSLEVFAGFIKLNELHLTDVSTVICDCPGGNFSWNSFSNGSCMGRKDLCNSTFSPRINCTKNSMCVENGPGNFLCRCKPNFHGYKCLNEGEFPTLLFALSICLGTLLLSGFMWQTQRRYVKQN